MYTSKLKNRRRRNSSPRKQSRAIQRAAAKKRLQNILAGLAIVGMSFGISYAHSPSNICPNSPALNPEPPALQGPSPIINFAPGSIIIPMDNCYQRSDKVSDPVLETAVDQTYGVSATMASKVCAPNSAGDFGQIAAYLMVRKLIAAGVGVSWAIRDSKSAWADFDIEIAAGVGAAVKHMTRTGVLSDPYTGLGSMKYAGAPFVIAAADAPLAMTVLAANGGADMDAIDFHLVQESFDAPIFRTMRSIPKFAVLDFGGLFDGGDMIKMNSSLADAGLVAGTDFDYISATQMQSGALIANGYSLAFIPSYKGGLPVSLAEIGSLLAIEAYVANGGSVVAQEDAIPSLEGEGTFNSSTGLFIPTTLPAMSPFFTHSIGGIHYSRINSVYGGNNASEVLASDDYSDPASQWGGANWAGLGGAKSNWITSCQFGYRDGVRRQLYTTGQVGDENDVDFASWKYYNNDSTLGRIYYLGGKNWRKGTNTGFRLLLNTILVTASDAAAPTYQEASRSAPIIAAIDGGEYQFSGTFEIKTPLVPGPQYGGKADDNTFEFPDVKGHLRAVDTTILTGGPVDTSIVANRRFDVAARVASMTTDPKKGCAVDGDCRHIFTNNGNTKVMLTTDDMSDFQAEFGFQSDGSTPFKKKEAEVLIERIHAGFDTGGNNYIPALGGVDRSTVAVIQPSPTIGVDRATVAYFGALDGMIHAVCAGVSVAPCEDASKLGKELWAFMPRSQLKNVPTNQTRIDGSPKVSDVFADFGSGAKNTRTVLTFQSGTNDAAATYALDITDPLAPDILWEHSTPGGGLATAIGVINVPTEGLTSVTFIQTSLGSSASNAGMYLAAVRSSDGSVVWSSTQQYPAARGLVNGVSTTVSDVPTTGIPGGVSIFATSSGGLVDTLLVPSLWGAVWQLDPRTGDSKVGTAVCTGTAIWQDTAGCTPLFQFKDDYHPIGASVSVYRERGTQSLHAVVVTGGFTDNDQPSASIWAPSSVTQYAVSFGLDVATDDGVILAAADPAVGIYVSLGAGNRAFSPAVILGNEIFITTDSADVFGVGAPTGQLVQANLSTGVAAPVTAIVNGFASVGVSAASSAVYTGDGAFALKTDITGYDADGITVEQAVNVVARFLWLRGQ